MKSMKILFPLFLGCTFLLGMVWALGGNCRFLPNAPVQSVTDYHVEPMCSWAKSHACTKARQQINCGECVQELSVTNSACTPVAGGNRASCTIQYKCGYKLCIEVPEY